jgi:hypothetical protein
MTSWLARTWALCASQRCTAEILRNRAVAAGWFERPEGGWLCPVHRPGAVPRGGDWASRAAGEREDP